MIPIMSLYGIPIGLWIYAVGWLGVLVVLPAALILKFEPAIKHRKRNVSKLRLSRTGDWSIEFCGHEPKLNSSRVAGIEKDRIQLFGRLALIMLTTQSEKYHFAIWQDSDNQASFHRLKVYLNQLG